MNCLLKTVPVCSGGQINLTCQATPNETLLQWSLSLPDRSHPEIRYISSRGNAQSVTPLTVGRTVFQFFRTSTSPLDLTSEIVISNVSVELNGTRVACSSGGSLMSVTFISVIKNGMVNQMYQNLTLSYNVQYKCQI